MQVCAIETQIQETMSGEEPIAEGASSEKGEKAARKERLNQGGLGIIKRIDKAHTGPYKALLAKEFEDATSDDPPFHFDEELGRKVFDTELDQVAPVLCAKQAREISRDLTSQKGTLHSVVGVSDTEYRVLVPGRVLTLNKVHKKLAQSLQVEKPEDFKMIEELLSALDGEGLTGSTTTAEGPVEEYRHYDAILKSMGGLWLLEHSKGASITHETRYLWCYKIGYRLEAGSIGTQFLPVPTDRLKKMCAGAMEKIQNRKTGLFCKLLFKHTLPDDTTRELSVTFPRVPVCYFRNQIYIDAWKSTAADKPPAKAAAPAPAANTSMDELLDSLGDDDDMVIDDDDGGEEEAPPPPPKKAAPAKKAAAAPKAKKATKEAAAAAEAPAAEEAPAAKGKKKQQAPKRRFFDDEAAEGDDDEEEETQIKKGGKKTKKKQPSPKRRRTVDSDDEEDEDDDDDSAMADFISDNDDVLDERCDDSSSDESFSPSSKSECEESSDDCESSSGGSVCAAEEDPDSYVSGSFTKFLEKMGRYLENMAERQGTAIVPPITSRDTWQTIQGDHRKFQHLCEVWLLLRFNPSVALFGGEANAQPKSREQLVRELIRGASGRSNPVTEQKVLRLISGS